MSEKTLNLIKDSEARWVDLRFTDTKGKGLYSISNLKVILPTGKLLTTELWVDALLVRSL